jgi:hypothetical protein
VGQENVAVIDWVQKQELGVYVIDNGGSVKDVQIDIFVLKDLGERMVQPLTIVLVVEPAEASSNDFGKCLVLAANVCGRCWCWFVVLQAPFVGGRPNDTDIGNCRSIHVIFVGPLELVNQDVS